MKGLGKPTFETELFRAWKRKNYKRKTSEDDCKIKYKSQEFSIMGFNRAFNKDNELEFAYKFKHEQKGIVFFIPEGREKTEAVSTALIFLKIVADKAGYNLIDMRLTLDSIIVEAEHGRLKDTKPR